MMYYTEIIDGFQIRDVTYFEELPEDTPIKFDVVKWYDHETYEVTNFRTGKKEASNRCCCSVAFLAWNRKEKRFDFEEIGERWEEVEKTEKVVDMISEFTRKKGEELCKT